MNNRFAKYAAVAVVAVAVTAALAYAQAGPGGHFFGGQAMGQRIFGHVAEQLGLTEAQKTQAKTILEQAHAAAQPVREQLQQNRQAIADAVKAGKSDTELQALSATTGNLVGQMTAIHTQAMSKVYALLTPEQKQKADELHQQFRDRIRQHFGQHPGQHPAGE